MLFRSAVVPVFRAAAGFRSRLPHPDGPAAQPAPAQQTVDLGAPAAAGPTEIDGKKGRKAAKKAAEKAEKAAAKAEKAGKKAGKKGKDGRKSA